MENIPHITDRALIVATLDLLMHLSRKLTGETPLVSVPYTNGEMGNMGPFGDRIQWMSKDPLTVAQEFLSSRQPTDPHAPDAQPQA